MRECSCQSQTRVRYGQHVWSTCVVNTCGGQHVWWSTYVVVNMCGQHMVNMCGQHMVNIQAAVNWRPGQQVFVATSIWRDEVSNQNEVRSIVRVEDGGRAVVLDAPLQFGHYRCVCVCGVGGYVVWVCFGMCVSEIPLCSAPLVTTPPHTYITPLHTSHITHCMSCWYPYHTTPPPPPPPPHTVAKSIKQKWACSHVTSSSKGPPPPKPPNRAPMCSYKGRLV